MGRAIRRPSIGPSSHASFYHVAGPLFYEEEAASGKGIEAPVRLMGSRAWRSSFRKRDGKVGEGEELMCMEGWSG